MGAVIAERPSTGFECRKQDRIGEVGQRSLHATPVLGQDERPLVMFKLNLTYTQGSVSALD
jgi:hypothetical protein